MWEVCMTLNYDSSQFICLLFKSNKTKSMGTYLVGTNLFKLLNENS